MFKRKKLFGAVALALCSMCDSTAARELSALAPTEPPVVSCPAAEGEPIKISIHATAHDGYFIVDIDAKIMPTKSPIDYRIDFDMQAKTISNNERGIAGYGAPWSEKDNGNEAIQPIDFEAPLTDYLAPS